MQAMSIRIFLILFLLILIYPSSLPAATEQRIALVIGNGAYSAGPLKNPVNDATDMAVALKRAGFTVMLKKNANLQEMVEAIETFGNNLKRGGVGLFYYAGHGVQVSSVNYLLPISAKINKETDVRFQAVDAGRVLAEMENANNGLNIVILDACRDNPFGKSFRSASRGLAIVANAPSGTFISYSTGAGQVAGDGEGKNSPYTKALLENIAKPGLTINKVFMNVRSKVKKETGQVPWELSSLEGDFFFMQGSLEKSSAMIPAGKMTAARDELDDENKKLEAEQRSLEEEKASFAKQKVLDEKRQQIAEERARLEAAKEVQRQTALERKHAKKSITALVDINNATQKELEDIKGMGSATAKKIIAGRPYQSTEELTKAGISAKAVATIMPFVTVGNVQKSAVKSTATKLAPGTKININTADKAALEALPEMGPVKAQAIIDGRPYKSIEDIMKVKGIKQRFFGVIKDYLVI
jgi:DNA uptake protein ComE-like DNA-binding protein